MSKKKILIYIGSPLLSLTILTATVYAVSMAVSGGNRIANDGTAVTITANSICKTVKNNGNLGDIFVPTNTANEWSAFLSHQPSYVTLGECCTPAATQYNYPGCSSGVGSITQQKVSTCPGPTYPTDWTTTSNTCLTCTTRSNSGMWDVVDVYCQAGEVRYSGYCFGYCRGSDGVNRRCEGYALAGEGWRCPNPNNSGWVDQAFVYCCR